MMNQKASELGMENTNFQNPHGLDDHKTIIHQLMIWRS